jgi:hypothetical protein
MKKVALIAAAISMMAPTFAAAADSAKSLSIASGPVRASAPAGKTKAAGGGLLAILAVVAMGGGIFLLADNDSDTPDSN